jgi:hypothetical protein
MHFLQSELWISLLNGTAIESLVQLHLGFAAERKKPQRSAFAGKKIFSWF